LSGPFIFIATNRLKPGKLGDERARVPGLVEFVEANEPQLLAFNEYADDEGTEAAVVAERAAAAYREGWRPRD
jgi:hypothetical protein